MCAVFHHLGQRHHALFKTGKRCAFVLVQSNFEGGVSEANLDVIHLVAKVIEATFNGCERLIEAG